MFDPKTTQAKKQATSEPTAAQSPSHADHRDADLALGSARRVGYSFAHDVAQAESPPIQRRANNTGLPDALKTGVENLSGLSMDDVKVHYGSSKPAGLNALAYTQGTDIHVAPGQAKHLPHEAWHVVQQMQGRVKPTVQAKGVGINDDRGLEKEAEVMGGKVQTASIANGSQNGGLKEHSASSQGPSITPIPVSASGVIQRVPLDENQKERVRNKAVETRISLKVLKEVLDENEQRPKKWRTQKALLEEMVRRQGNPVAVSTGMAVDKKRKRSDHDGDDSEGEDEPKGSHSSKRKKYTRGQQSKQEQETKANSSKTPQGRKRKRSEGEEEIEESDSTGQPGGSEEPKGKKQKIIKSPSIPKWWEEKAKALQDKDKVLKNIKIEKIALILMIYHHGIFNALGQGGNPRYIRSDKNAVIKLIGEGLPAAKNKAGEIPDVYQGIAPKEWNAVVEVLGKSKEDVFPKDIASISQYIEKQREISKGIQEKIQEEHPELKDGPAGMVFIFNDNYPALNIHFPRLMNYIKENQERKGKKPEVRAGQGKGMTKFLMARLIHLCNTNIKSDQIKLREKSSFGFQTPTLGDLGTNMSIRLSPGIHDVIIEPVVQALVKLHKELSKLMTDDSTHSFEKITTKSPMYPYWGPGGKGKGPNADWLMSSYNQKKTKLNHLLFTQVEKGTKGHTIIGRTLERNHANLLHLAQEDKSLTDWANFILDLHAPKKLGTSLNNGTLKAPELSSNEVMHTAKDNETEKRLALFQATASSWKKDENPNEADEEASDSEYEGEGERKGEKLFMGKAVVPSGMAALSQVLGGEAKGKDQVKSKMKPGLYYEDFDHAKKNFNLAGYTTKDVVIADLNPNITTSDESKTVGGDIQSVLKQLNNAKAKVWVVDLTSATLEEQKDLVASWRENLKTELLITIVSGLKHQELGLNSNPHGLVHWMYKGEDRDKLKKLKEYFKKMRAKPVNKRSKISNEMRRFFKERGSYSWKRLADNMKFNKPAIEPSGK
jgi:hypothetical protein